MPNFAQDLSLLKSIIGKQSTTPNDCGIQETIYQDLLLFQEKNNLKLIKISRRQVYNFETHNSLITIESTIAQEPLKSLGFLGHTDVVPADPTQWSHHPFQLTQEGSHLYGRGLVDMKGAIYCFIEALKEFLYRNQKRAIPKINIFLTSDEEGSGKGGVSTLLEKFSLDPMIFLLIGEPTSSNIVGDFIKTGRRGSLHGYLLLKGEQYHVAYRQEKKIFKDLEKVLKTLNSLDFPESKESFFDKTTLEITEVSSEKTVENVIPGKASIRFNIRNTPSFSFENIKRIFEEKLNILELTTQIKITWRQGGQPWLSTLSEQDIQQLLPNHKVQTTTTGGLSDGWKFHIKGVKQIFELGLKNKTAHRANESCTVEDLRALSNLYYITLESSLSFSS